MSITNQEITENEKHNVGPASFEELPDSTFLDKDQAAEFLRLSPNTLQFWRSTGRYGLPYIKSGRRVFYMLGALRAFVNSRIRTCAKD